MVTTPLGDGFRGRGGMALPTRTSSAFLAGGAVAIGVYFTLGFDGKAVWYVVIGPLSQRHLLVLAVERGRSAWYLFGSASRRHGDAVSGYYEVVSTGATGASAADVLYLGGYPLIIAGIVCSRELGVHRTDRLLDRDVTVAAALCSGSFVEPYAHSSLTRRTSSRSGSRPWTCSSSSL